MLSQPVNQLIIMSDEHARRLTGCYGDKIVQTPNLDRLAARGTRFAHAYTPVPICVPARAAFATGLPGHVSGHWDNATPYSGKPDSWGHVLQRAGLSVGSIGKLHYRNEDDSVGFDFQHLPMHVVNGVGDVLGCVRDPLPVREKGLNMALKIGSGETSYSNYDRDITSRTVEWLSEKSPSDTPWTLFVSFVCPHFPLIAPAEYYALYEHLELSPTKSEPSELHPWLQELRTCMNFAGFTDEKTRVALTAYYALVTFMDAQVGAVLDALEQSGLRDSTRVTYTSDHGDNIGERGFWGKSTMYEESAGVPMIMAGPGIPAGHVCSTPVSLLDIFPTVLHGAGIEEGPSGRQGRSMVTIATEPDDDERVVFSEYHAMGAISGAFMIRQGKWKFIHYVGYAPQLFDLDADPDELRDLGKDEQFADVRARLLDELLHICDPMDVDRHARADQAALVTQHGGQDAIVAKGGFGATPPPGEKPRFV